MDNVEPRFAVLLLKIQAIEEVLVRNKLCEKNEIKEIARRNLSEFPSMDEQTKDAIRKYL